MTTTNETPRQRRRRKAAAQHAAYGSYWPGKYLDVCRELDEARDEIERLREHTDGCFLYDAQMRWRDDDDD